MRRLPDVATFSRALADLDVQSVENVRVLVHTLVLDRLDLERFARRTLDSDGSVLSTKGHAEGTAVGFNKLKKGARSYFFDFNKAEIKPESHPALEQVAKLLKGSPALKVWVVGHTDWVGSAETNTALSNARAAAVVRALTQQFGIEPRRLAPQGVGPYAPAPTNTTDEGRARNRRVELVA